MILGAHVRRRQQGIEGAIEEARLRDADCVQIFVSNPRSWAEPRYDDDAADRFRSNLEVSGIDPCAAHMSYIGNAAAWKAEFLEKTRALIAATVRACDALGVRFLVLHAGAGGPQGRDAALRTAAETFRHAVGEADRVRVLVELMAGTSGAVASLPHEAEQLLDEIGDDRVGLTLDTAHLFAAGVALDEPEGVTALSDDLRARGLAERLALVHANDSEFERGEHRDRHANIGDGVIGGVGWRAIRHDPLLSSVPWILETPGDAERQRDDIAHLRNLGPPG